MHVLEQSRVGGNYEYARKMAANVLQPLVTCSMSLGGKETKVCYEKWTAFHLSLFQLI
jgi:hypothetical protein